MITEEFAKEQRLSKNFTLYEFLYSDEATLYGLMHEQMLITTEQIGNAQELCINILQPLRDYLKKPVTINSGFRSLKLNTRIKGAKNSDHLHGKAADIHCNFSEAYNFISNNCKFKQLIIEKDKKERVWIHISYDKLNNKMQRLAYNGERYFSAPKNIYNDYIKDL